MNKKYEKPTDDKLRTCLTPEQYKVTQRGGTEAPFHNPYWDNKKPGIYVDIVTGEPLFSSLDKFDSGTGWPSFTKPLEKERIVEHEDTAMFMKRTEVRSKDGDSHLGHVFDDGPAPTGLRYCINSAALKFIPAQDLEKEGYGQYAALFASAAGVSPKKGAAASTRETATFAGGCFWGVEELIRKLPGVIETVVGYTGGKTDKPVYNQVKHGDTGHAEAIQVIFDPQKISYEELIAYFFRLHDPTTKNRQGNDVGTQYRSVIFYHSEEQKKTAELVRERVDKSGKWDKPVVTEIVKAGPFFPAEDYHQKYLMKNPNGYTCHWVRN